MSDWKDKADKIKFDLAAKIPKEWLLPEPTLPLPLDVSHLIESTKLLSSNELEIVNHDATGLRDAMAKREYTALAVTKVFAKAVAIVHQGTNCITDFFPDEAMERAKKLDEEMEKTGKPVGVMHGVPISVKATFGVKGRLGMMGFVSSVEVIPTDANTVGILRNAGAVFICKTTLPQAVMHLETDSFLGPTLNPYNRTLTPGGSSGGESALIAGRGSVMGIRGPAALCGIYGFKPTVGRLPKGGGGLGLMKTQETMPWTNGPMARSARDLELFFTTILDSKPWEDDPSCLKMPWRKDEVVWKGKNGMKVGVMWDDGVVRPQPPMRRAMSTVVEKLRKNGVEVVDYKPFRSAEAWNLISSLYFSDGGARIRKLASASGEPLLPLTEWIITRNTKERTAEDLMQLAFRREVFRVEYLQYFNSQNVDVILCPPCPGPAPVLGTSKYWNYTSLWNLVDYPGAVFPTGLTVEKEDVPDPEYEFLSESDKEVWKAYDSPGTFKGAPLGLQIQGARFEDEKVMAALHIISEIVHS